MLNAMREGVLDVVWENRPHRGSDGVYRVLFYVLPTAHDLASLGDVKQHVFPHGEDAVRDLLWKDLLKENPVLQSRADGVDE